MNRGPEAVRFSKSATGTDVLSTELRLPLPGPQVFGFFCDALNLNRITPPYLRFQVLTPCPIDMRAGTLIEYRIRLHGIPLRWLTRISVWDPPHRFVDEQVRGPYLHWVHEHGFQERGGETLCTDRVEYAVPGGWLVDRLLVRRDLRRIFTFRRQALLQLLGDPVP